MSTKTVSAPAQNEPSDQPELVDQEEQTTPEYELDPGNPATWASREKAELLQMLIHYKKKTEYPQIQSWLTSACATFRNENSQEPDCPKLQARLAGLCDEFQTDKPYICGTMDASELHQAVVDWICCILDRVSPCDDLESAMRICGDYGPDHGYIFCNRDQIWEAIYQATCFTSIKLMGPAIRAAIDPHVDWRKVAEDVLRRGTDFEYAMLTDDESSDDNESDETTTESENLSNTGDE